MLSASIKAHIDPAAVGLRLSKPDGFRIARIDAGAVQVIKQPYLGLDIQSALAAAQVIIAQYPEIIGEVLDSAPIVPISRISKMRQQVKDAMTRVTSLDIAVIHPGPGS